MSMPETRKPLRCVSASRYITPLREGGSLPAIVEADDLGLYVVKFRGAGQGPRALIAELVAGELARAGGLPIPEIVFIEVDPEFARNEPDGEIQHLIRASAGLNLALDYLPGAAAFDPAVETPDPWLASRIVWFDALVMNVDRTARNTNLMVWHRQLRLIDHGAALYFHHNWESADRVAAEPFARIGEHVLLGCASELPAADAEMSARIDAAAIDAAVSHIPDSWLPTDEGTPDTQRARYARILVRRLGHRAAFVQEALRARTRHL
jgi:hypothetical protein